MKPAGSKVKFPIFRTSRELFHRGRLADSAPINIAPRHSHEAHCLSVSRHPDAWDRIARLSGDLFALKKPRATFLQMREVMRSPELVLVVTNWAQSQGLIEPATIFEVYSFDDELDEEVFSSFESIDDARVETEDDSVIKTVDGWRGTEKLQAASLAPTPVSLGFVLDFAVLHYAEQVLCTDGAWWEDRLDVAALSAPRGGIFRPAEWNVELHALVAKSAHLQR